MTTEQEACEHSMRICLITAGTNDCAICENAVRSALHFHAPNRKPQLGWGSFESMRVFREPLFDQNRASLNVRNASDCL
jgi:hypothetical protein